MSEPAARLNKHTNEIAFLLFFLSLFSLEMIVITHFEQKLSARNKEKRKPFNRWQCEFSKAGRSWSCHRNFILDDDFNPLLCVLLAEHEHSNALEFARAVSSCWRAQHRIYLFITRFRLIVSAPIIFNYCRSKW